MKAIELLKKDLKYIDQIIEIYREYINEAENVIKLSGKRIDIANAEHSGWSSYFHEKSVEVKHIKEYMQMRLNEVHGTLWIKFTEKMNIVLAQKDKEQYIRTDTAYLDINEQFLKIQELYDQFQRINDGFTTRGYCLNNLTRLLVASNNDWIIP